MDRVKLGRALGYGTRHAAKTLAAVAEAAAAPDPRGPEQRREMPVEPEERRGPATQPRLVRRVAATQVRTAGRSMWAPLATFSNALWLRVTGLFFAIVAITMFGGAWRLRGVLRTGADPRSLQHFWIFAGIGVLFGYFAVSSFVRATLRERTGGARG